MDDPYEVDLIDGGELAERLRIAARLSQGRPPRFGPTWSDYFRSLSFDDLLDLRLGLRVALAG